MLAGLQLAQAKFPCEVTQGRGSWPRCAGAAAKRSEKPCPKALVSETQQRWAKISDLVPSVDFFCLVSYVEKLQMEMRWPHREGPGSQDLLQHPK